MTNQIVALGMPGALEFIIVIIVFCIPIVLVIWFIKMFIKNKNENIRLRLEVGKLADELEKLRKKANPKL